MKALVDHGPGHEAWETGPAPQIVDETDAMVGVELVTRAERLDARPLASNRFDVQPAS